MSEVIQQGYGDYVHLSVHVDGLDACLRYFEKVNPELEKVVKDELKEAAQPVLTAARANAQGIAATGHFASSMSLRVYKRGQVRLRSNDPAAGVIEFAKIGAKTLTSKGTPLANKRLALQSGVGVPRRANPPRAMYKAINEHIDAVARDIDDRLERVLNRV